MAGILPFQDTGATLPSAVCNRVARDWLDWREFSRDILKNSTGNGRLRVSDDDTLKGRLLVAFVAVVLHKAVENELRDAGMLADTSVNKALDLARKFNVLCLDGRRRMPLEVPKKSRVIYEVVAPGLLKTNGVEPGDAAAEARAKKAARHV